MSSYKGRGGHRHTSQMTDSPSLSHHTSECNFSATKHSPTGEELKNNVKSPTTNYRRFLEQDILIDEDNDDDNKPPHAQNSSKDDDMARRALEVKALKFFVETLFTDPDDPSLPLVQINALNDIKKLHDDELINITADENTFQLFDWGIGKCTAQDGWFTQAPLTPNIDDDDDQTFLNDEDDDDNKLSHAHNLSKDDDIHDDLKGNHAFRTTGGTGRLDFGGGNNFLDFDEDDYIQLPHAQNVLNDEDDIKFSSRNKEFKHIVDGNISHPFLLTHFTDDDEFSAYIAAQEAQQCKDDIYTNAYYDEDSISVSDEDF